MQLFLDTHQGHQDDRCSTSQAKPKELSIKSRKITYWCNGCIPGSPKATDYGIGHGFPHGRLTIYSDNRYGNRYSRYSWRIQSNINTDWKSWKFSYHLIYIKTIEGPQKELLTLLAGGRHSHMPYGSVWWVAQGKAVNTLKGPQDFKKKLCLLH